MKSFFEAKLFGPLECFEVWWTYDLAALHVASFKKIILDLEVVHEGVIMKLCVLTLEGDVDTWYEICSLG